MYIIHYKTGHQEQNLGDITGQELPLLEITSTGMYTQAQNWENPKG